MVKGSKHSKKTKQKIGEKSKGNQYAKGNKPNKTSFKEGQHPSPKTEFKKGYIPPSHKKGCKCFRCSKIPWIKGKHHSKKTKEILSQKGKGRPNLFKGKKRPEFSGEKHPNWKNGRRKINNYWYIYIPNHPFATQKCVLEHRLVVEKQIGRYLLPTEPCHHLGKRNDNRPHMLMAFTSKSAHQRFHHNPDNVKPSEIIFDGRKFSTHV